MKFETLSKKLLIAFFLFVLSVMLGAILGWRLLNQNFIEHKIHSLLSSLPKNISVDVDKIYIRKQFPYLYIFADNVSVNYQNKIEIKANDVNDRISLSRILTSLVFGSPYYGDIRIKTANLKYIINEQNNNVLSHENVKLIPVNINIEKLKIKYKNNVFVGALRGKYASVLKRYDIVLKGCFDYAPLELSAQMKQNSIYVKFFVKTQKIKGLKIKDIRGNVLIKNLNNFSVNVSSMFASYKTVNIEKPSVNISFKLLKKGILINRLQLDSNNGYFLYLSGFLNVNKYDNSNIKGKLSTPYINIKPYIKLVSGENLTNYILKCKLSLSDVQFEGHPSLKFIKSGTVHAKDTYFRIDNKSSVFVVKKGKIAITPQLFVIQGNGHFEDILFSNSVIKIHRVRGYPCDMDLKYKGVANDLARIFLEENIFSKNDLKVLGKSRALRGKFSATTKIEGYRWKAEPFFNFNIVIHSNGVEFYNSNIPSKFIKSWGTVQIKRVVQKGRVKTLFVRLKTLRARGFASDIKTDDFTISIKPKLSLKGSFEANLSKNDLNYLINHIVRKRINIARSSTQIKAFVSGNLNNFKYKGFIHYSIYQSKNKPMVVAASCTGGFKNGILAIENLMLSDNLQASGMVNMRHFTFNLEIVFRRFNVKTITPFIKKRTKFFIKRGFIDGSIHITGDINKLVEKVNGNIKLIKGYVSNDINDVNGKIEFNSYVAKISNASATIFKTPVKFNGLVNYKDNLRVTLHSSANNLVFDLNNVDEHQDKLSFEMPKLDIHATLNVGNFFIKYKNRIKNMNSTRIEFYNKSGHGFLKIKARKTMIYISRENKKIRINIKDYNIFSFLTNCKNKDNLFTLKADLQTSNPYDIDVSNLKGHIDFLTKNGEFKNVSNALKIISLTNIIETIFGKSKPQKHLPYKKIVASLVLNKGVLRTKKDTLMSVYGKNLNIFIRGRYDIMKRYVDIYATFTTLRSVNKLISKIPVIGWIISGKERSFTGVNFHIEGNVNKKLSIKPVPLRGLGEGFLGILKRALMLPFHAIGVGK